MKIRHPITTGLAEESKKGACKGDNFKRNKTW